MTYGRMRSAFHTTQAVTRTADACLSSLNLIYFNLYLGTYLIFTIFTICS